MSHPLPVGEYRETGLETLERFNNARRFNAWMYDRIAAYCRGNVLEIGSGTGNISEQLLNSGARVVLSDMNDRYCARLRERFAGHGNLQSIEQVNLSVAAFESSYPTLIGRFDTVVAFNVIEHIEDDKLAVRNARLLLNKGGRLIILVPAFQWMYNSLDKALDHFRRYRSRQVKALVTQAGLTHLHTEYFNIAGMPGWWINGTLRRKKLVPAGQLRIFDALVPLLRLIDKLFCYRFGLSVITVSQNNS